MQQHIHLIDTTEKLNNLAILDLSPEVLKKIETYAAQLQDLLTSLRTCTT